MLFQNIFPISSDNLSVFLKVFRKISQNCVIRLENNTLNKSFERIVAFRYFSEIVQWHFGLLQKFFL